MIRSINGQADQFLADLERIQNSTERAQRQMTSGLRVAEPSDAPDQVSQILKVRASLALAQQRQSNLSLTKTEVDTAEQALQTAVQVVERGATLAAQGATGTSTDADRQIIAGEVRSLADELVGLSNTAIAGKYVFSGDHDQVPAYSRDDSASNGVDRLLVSSNTRREADASGETFLVGHTAQEIFDRRNGDDSLATGNVFAAVHNLEVALDSNDQGAILAASTALAKAGDYLNRQLAFYGTVQDRLASATTQADQIVLQQKTNLSTLQDADMTEAIMELTQGRTAQQAALAAQAQLPKTSLFDFLK